MATTGGVGAPSVVAGDAATAASTSMGAYVGGWLPGGGRAAAPGSTCRRLLLGCTMDARSLAT